MKTKGQKTGCAGVRKTGSKKQYYIYGNLCACVYPHMWGLRVSPTHGVIHTLSQKNQSRSSKGKSPQEAATSHEGQAAGAATNWQL